MKTPQILLRAAAAPVLWAPKKREQEEREEAIMTDIVGSRTLRSQWDDTVAFYADNTFLEYISGK